MPKNLLVSEAAVIFRRSQRTIRRWVREGLFPNVIRVKDGYLIPESDITQLNQDKSGANRGHQRTT